MLGPFATASRFTLPFIRCRYCRTPPLSHAACASMSTTTTTTTTTTRDREGTAMAPWNGPNNARIVDTVEELFNGAHDELLFTNIGVTTGRVYLRASSCSAAASRTTPSSSRRPRGTARTGTSRTAARPCCGTRFPSRAANDLERRAFRTTSTARSRRPAVMPTSIR